MSQAPFNAEETTEILRFLGYPDWVSTAQSIQLGFPSTSQPLFLVRDSLKRISPTARAHVRQYLCELRSIEAQMSDARSRFEATQLDKLHVNPREIAQLNQQYVFWRRRLADDLGVVPNPYSQIDYNGLAGGMTAKVVS